MASSLEVSASLSPALTHNRRSDDGSASGGVQRPSPSAFHSSPLSPSHPHTDWYHRRTLKRILKHVWIFLQASVALISAIIAWLGLWELFDLYFFPRTTLRDVLYVLLSGLLMTLCGTYLPNCGIWEDETRQADAAREALESAENVLNGLESPNQRVTNMTMPTTGTIDDQDDEERDQRVHQIETSRRRHLEEDRHGLIEASSEESGESDSISYTRACWFLSTELCSWKIFFHVYVVSFVSLFASIAFWTGAYNLLMSFFLLLSHDIDWLAYTLNLLMGWFLMWITGTLFDQAGLSEDEGGTSAGTTAMTTTTTTTTSTPPDRNSCTRLRVYMRATIAIIGCMQFWLGASMLLEIWSQVYYTSPRDGDDVLRCDECIESTPTRNGIFILLGFLLFILTDTLAIHAGVEESNKSTHTAIPTSSSDANGVDGGAAASSSSSSHVVVGDTDEARLMSFELDHLPSDQTSSSSSPPPPRPSLMTRLMSHSLMKHVRALASLTGVMLLWEGIWDAAFDPRAEHEGWSRMVLYSCLGICGLMFTNSLFSNSGVVPPFAIARRSTEVQRRVGFQLQEKSFQHLVRGGYVHDHTRMMMTQSAVEERKNQSDTRMMNEQDDTIGHAASSTWSPSLNHTATNKDDPDFLPTSSSSPPPPPTTLSDDHLDLRPLRFETTSQFQQPQAHPLHHAIVHNTTTTTTTPTDPTIDASTLISPSPIPRDVASAASLAEYQSMK